MLKVIKIEAVPFLESGWAVVGENSGAIIKTFDRKNDAKDFCEFVNKNEFKK